MVSHGVGSDNSTSSLPVVRSMCEINLEAELFTLQDSNAKLVEALQEANSSVEQWKKQLSEYQEETDRLRDQVTCTSLENVTLWKRLSGYLGENNCDYLKSIFHSQEHQVSIALLLQCILGFVVFFICLKILAFAINLLYLC